MSKAEKQEAVVQVSERTKDASPTRSVGFMRRPAVLLLATLGIASAQLAPAQGEAFWWESQTSGNFTARYSTQQEAINDWLEEFSGLEQEGPCGALGTSQYQSCPLKSKTTGQHWGVVSVPLLCAPKTGTGSVLSPDGQSCPFYYVSAEPLQNGSDEKDPKFSDPIYPLSGDMRHHEVDASTGSLTFERFYRSSDSGTSSLSGGWRHSFSRRVVESKQSVLFIRQLDDPRNSPFYPSPDTACSLGWPRIRGQVPELSSSTATFADGACRLTVNGTEVGSVFVRYDSDKAPPESPTVARYDLIRDDGQVIAYRMLGSALVAPSGQALKFQTISGGYQITTEDETVETYATGGRLISATTRGGVTVTASYDASNRLSALTDSFGSSIVLGYDGSGRLATVSSGGIVDAIYAYDAQGRLSTVTRADSTSRTYVYGNATFPNALTGIDDETGTRFNTWGYDAYGRATSASGAGGAHAATVVYNSASSIQVTDALGAVRTFTSTRVGHVSKSGGISGSQCPSCKEGKTTTYDSAGFVSSSRDYNNNLTCFANDARGLDVVRVEGFAPAISSCPANLLTYLPTAGTKQRKISTTWHASLRLPLSITEPNRTTTFTYDSSGDLLTSTITDTSVVPNASRTWTYTYDSFGQILTEDGPRTDVSDVITYAYYNCSTGAQCGQLYTITNALGHVMTFNSYNAKGRPTQITDANGLVMSLAYDVRQRLTDRCVGSTLPGCSGGELTHLDYWSTGKLKKVTNPDGSFIEYTYDAAHRLTQINDGAQNKVVYTLDALGNRTAENTYDPSSTLRRTHARVFNTLSQLSKDVNAAGTAAVTTTFGYDTNGNPTSANAPLSRNRTSLYDELNRLKQTTEPGSAITQFGYDANDNLTSVTDPRSLVTSYTYTGFGDLKTQTSPDTGLTSNTYDSSGNLDTSTDSRGAVTDYDYDAENRATSVSFTLGGATDQTITYGYDAGTNQKGKLTSASDANHSLAWSYDTQGRITGKGQTVGGVTLSMGYGYNSAGQLASTVLPSGSTITVGYNSNGHVSSLTLNGSTTILSGITYDPFGPITSWTWGNGTSANRAFDTDGKVTQVDNASGVSLKNYGYDDAFRVTGISDAADSTLSWTYGYDNRDRLNSATKTGTTQGWTYDANGNRQTQTGTSPSTYTNSSTSNRVSSIAGSLARTYAYDAAGNTLSYAGATFTYNNRGRMATASNGGVTATYAYNALGQRIKRTAAGVTTLYVYDEAGHLAGEYAASGALIQETVWLGDTPVATLRPNGSGGVVLYYVHADHLNTPRLVTDTSNAVLWRWDSDPFGATAPNENPSSLGVFVYNLRFPGQQFDGVAGLNYNYYRDGYDPAIGRYNQSDPLGLIAGMNTFGYVSANPISSTDRFGLKEFPDSFVGPLRRTDYYTSEMIQTKCGRIPPSPPGVDINANMALAKGRWSPFWFRDQVKNKGPWDYKQLAKLAPYNYIYTDFGNFNYGATGDAFGFSLDRLLREAGRAQQAAGTSKPRFGDPGWLLNPWGGEPPYGDDPEDQKQIRNGYNYCECMEN